jgi:hypothetical protein
MQSLNQNIFIASSLAIKLSVHSPTIDLSHVELHRITNRATTEIYTHHKLSILLYDSFNNKSQTNEQMH